MAARKLAAIAEPGRRNPRPEDAEFTADELGNALAESRARACALLGTAGHLDTRLPGTRAALRDGTVSMSRARIIASATGLLDPAGARAAEARVLDRAARLTPGALRAAIARAVIEVAPEKAKERRESSAKSARVERWARGLRQRRPGRPRAAPGRGPGGGRADHLAGGRTAQGRAEKAARTRFVPAPCLTCS